MSDLERFNGVDHEHFIELVSAHPSPKDLIVSI